MDLLQISDLLEEKLKAAKCCGSRIGSGCTMMESMVRDFQYEYGKVAPTQEMIDTFIKEITPEYTANLKLRETDFSVYVQMITKDASEEDIRCDECEHKPENVVQCQIHVDSDALVDTLLALSKDNRTSKIMVWDVLNGFNISFSIVDNDL